MLSNEVSPGTRHLVDDKLIIMTNKILTMRKKLDSVNTRFAYIRHELSDQHEYVAKLAKIKEVLEEQEGILKREVMEIAQNVLRQRSTPRPIFNIPQTPDINNLDKCGKEKYNRMVKLQNEIGEMKEFEEFQNNRLSELQRIKEIMSRLVNPVCHEENI